MDAKKIAKRLQQVEPERIRVTIHVDKAAYQGLQKRYPRHGKPSVSDVISELIAEYLKGLK